ncbi:MAG TPA: Trm112 family protein [Methanothermococcus okinawensis]|uniref:Trm112 family protein n=1 Tax=Methanothermococcus okinawensis TaxID=155863 RepID=A0A832YVZ5_9EURY|nr:Trm112 family protein [Methanothermococcus okinawensis]
MIWIEKYLYILQCPSCGGDLELKEYPKKNILNVDNIINNGNNNEYKLLCKKCNKIYDIVEEIPILLKK